MLHSFIITSYLLAMSSAAAVFFIVSIFLWFYHSHHIYIYLTCSRRYHMYMQPALHHRIVISAALGMMAISLMPACGSPLPGLATSTPTVASSSSLLVEHAPTAPPEHWLMDLDRPPAAELLIASTLIPTMPVPWSVMSSTSRTYPLFFSKLNQLVFQHPVSRTLIIGGVAIVASLTATKAYEVSISAAEGSNDHLDLDKSLLPAALSGDKPSPRPNMPPPHNELMIPIPRFSQDYAINDPPTTSSLVHLTSSKAPKSLLEQQQILEQKVITNQKQQQIIDRIHQLNLQLYAQKRGITVDKIPQDERLRLESEQNFKHITEHVNEFSDENMERLMTRIDELESAMTTLNTTRNSSKSERTIIGKLKQKHLNLVWQAIGAGVLFVLFL